jgi:putative acetyltransferase
VATLGDRVAGHVLLSACRLDAPRRIVDVLSLSPVGVLPVHQRQGIGTRLIRHALEQPTTTACRWSSSRGSPRFYGQRGFERAGAAGFRSPSLRALDCVGLREPGA